MNRPVSVTLTTEFDTRGLAVPMALLDRKGALTVDKPGAGDQSDFKHRDIAFVLLPRDGNDERVLLDDTGPDVGKIPAGLPCCEALLQKPPDPIRAHSIRFL